MTETIDNETGEIIPGATSVPAPRSPGVPTPYNSADTGQIAEALAAAQGEMESPKRTKTGKIQGTSKKSGKEYNYEYKYAPFEEVVRVIKASFPKQGLSYQQGLVIRGQDYFIRTFIRHSSGEWVASDYPVIADSSGPQGFAAATTYAKRYGLSLATGLAAEDDDDGAAAQEAAPEARATRANPAVQQPSLDRDAAVSAYRRIQAEIDEHELPEPMWPQADVETIQKFDGAGLIQLRQRLSHKLQLKEMSGTTVRGGPATGGMLAP